MKKIFIVLILVSVIFSGCVEPKPAQEKIFNVAELLENPVYEKEIKIQGKVSGLGEVLCLCFDLTSGEKSLVIWYDPVMVKGIENGDQVIVTGKLDSKEAGGANPGKDFWATKIELELKSEKLCNSDLDCGKGEKCLDTQWSDNAFYKLCFEDRQQD
ncbi:MAG: hypothetical protein COT90_05490 [Candidatus Diapherotrites archaeon CG10_big_fil_rev_8_21_14_0_10_31_34]|nr:MAG: hypothetical protein COT90_05490 [Candidatus Diapherotrites archaeon CG10_big_fil_rev_8_21_14_0_10_31_34]